MAGRIRLVMIGDELLDGRTYESNSHWLIQRLTGAGFMVAGSEIVGDGIEEIVDALGRATRDAALIVVSGGLGPTTDDRTREALAVFVGESLVEDASAVEEIRRRFESRGRSMPEANTRQALRPESAELLPNPIGTAPGVWQTHNGCAVVLVPGVPAEMRRMFEEQLFPRLESLELETRAGQIRLRVTGAGESFLAQLVEEVLAASGFSSISRAFCVQRDGLDIILRAHDLSADANQELERAADAVEAALAPHVYARGDGDLAALLLRRLASRGETLAVAESCTAGLLGGRIADTPGSSEVFLGGAIAYSNELKQSLVGVDGSTLSAHGAVSEQTAVELAVGIRRRTSADHALSVTGIAGPAGGSEDKPVGLVWIAHSSASGTEARELRFSGDRQQNRQWAVAAALNLLRRGLGDGRLDG